MAIFIAIFVKNGLLKRPKKLLDSNTFVFAKTVEIINQNMKKIIALIACFIVFLGLFTRLYAQTNEARIPLFKPTKPLKIYHEPLAYSAIIAVADPDLDSLQAYKIATQNGIDFLKIKMENRRTITLRNGKTETKTATNFGFIALYDLEERVAAELRKKLMTESFALCKINANYFQKKPINNSGIDKKLNIDFLQKTVTVTSYNGRKIVGNNGDKSQFLLTNKTRCMNIEDTEGEYLHAVVKHFKPNPDNVYTIQIQLKKRNFINWIFERSKYTIDSISETKKFAERQTIRRVDSCIAWYHDRSNLPMRWTGDCKEGYANGNGTLQLDTNRIFSGRLEMGMMQGEGTLRDNGWELKGTWNEGQLVDLRQANTVLFYKNSLPARDTTPHRLYPTRAPMVVWYKERNTRLSTQIQSFNAFRRNDIMFPYLKESFNLVLPDNENPALKTFKPTDCAAIHRWKSVGARRVSYSQGDAPFFHVWAKEHPHQEVPDGQVYYSAADNKWYWWGAFYTDGPYPTFQDALKDVCKCR